MILADLGLFTNLLAPDCLIKLPNKLWDLNAKKFADPLLF